MKFIEDNRFQTNEEIGPGYNPLKNGNYFNLKFDDKNSRILWYFMYWNLVEYFFPYKYVMDQKWDVTFKQILPLILEAQNDDEFYTVIRKTASKLNDSHVELTALLQYFITRLS